MTAVNRTQRRRLAVFVYDFPHRKSQDILLRCFAEDWSPTLVLAAPRVELPHTAARPRVKVRSDAAMHPRTIAERIGARYCVTAHSAKNIADIVSELEIELGLVAGARILPQSTVDAFPHGIVNLHPGLVPETRGLDALLWAIMADHPAGVTAHRIDHRVDAGDVLLRRTARIYPDDSLAEINLRLYEMQLALLRPALELGHEAGTPVPEGLAHNRAMTAEQVLEAIEKFPAWRHTHSHTTPS